MPTKYEQPQKKHYTVAEINEWLFGGVKKPGLPASKLVDGRHPEQYKHKKEASALQPIGEGTCTSRVMIHSGGITDIYIPKEQKGAVATSNNGDLLTGCGYAVAKAVINAAGPGLQTELYNRFGVPGVMQQPQGASDAYEEGRGYAITCNSYDMKESHNIDSIEVLTVPMNDQQGVINMYYEALVHSKDLDYILFPMAGMTHPVINHKSEKSAQFALAAMEKFIKDYPDSQLKIIYTIWNDKAAEEHYKVQAAKVDQNLAPLRIKKVSQSNTRDKPLDSPPSISVTSQSIFTPIDNNLLKATEKLKTLCAVYQTHLYDEIKKLAGAKSDPNEIIRKHVSNPVEPTDLDRIIKKAHIVNQMLNALNNENQPNAQMRIQDMSNVLTQDNKDALGSHRSRGGRFLQAVISVLAAIFRQDWTYRTDGEVLSDTIKSTLTA